jgi:hypothetical protein
MEFGTLGRQECTATDFNNLKRESSAGRRRICQYLNSHETRYMRCYARDRMTDIGKLHDQESTVSASIKRGKSSRRRGGRVFVHKPGEMADLRAPALQGLS